MDQKVCETRKKYNAMHAERQKKELQLEELQNKFSEMLGEHTAMSKTDLGESAEGQVGLTWHAIALNIFIAIHLFTNKTFKGVTRI